jgi:hypothetical protein
MSIKTIIAAATLVTALAAPAFAGDQDLQSLEVSSGRLAPQATVAPNGFTGAFDAYASAGNPVRHYANHGYTGSSSYQNDFQLQGR